MSSQKQTAWKIKERQDQLQSIANAFTEPDGVEYVVSLTIRERTPPQQLNLHFHEDKETHRSPKNDYL